MKITVAGAGAGKTTSMADHVLKKFKEITDGKIVYVVTYTNAARDKIRGKIKAECGTIPKRLFIETIHSFLLQEVIFPFNHLIYDEKYKTASQISLPNNPQYRAAKINELRSNQIIHVEEVTRAAKWILCKKSKDNKRIREKREKILSTVGRYLDTLFVDEAQDMDENFADILMKLDNIGIGVSLVGDPKQDLRGRESFKEIINEFQQIVEYKPENRRCPTSHIILSNSYISDEEAQVSCEDKPGNIQYIIESQVNGQQDAIILDYDYAYIFKKSERYITNKFDEGKAENNLSYELKELVKKTSINEKKIDQVVYILTKKIMKSISKLENNSILRWLEQVLTLSLTKKDCARVCSALVLLKNAPSDSGLLVHSIDRIKGLEGEKCLFILTPDMAPYMFKEKTTQNKMMNYLYVALTRSKHTLTILVTTETEEKYGIQYIENQFRELAIDRTCYF